MFDPWQGFCHLTQPNDQTMPPLNSVSASHLCLPCQFYLWSHFSSSCSPCGRLQMAATQGRSTQVVQLLLNPHFPWSWSSLSWLGNCFFDQCSWTLNRWDKGQRENINILSLYVFYQFETILNIETHCSFDPISTGGVDLFGKSYNFAKVGKYWAGIREE